MAWIGKQKMQRNPSPRAAMVPVVELAPDGTAKHTFMVPVNQLDSMVGELGDAWDFGLGEYHVESTSGVEDYLGELGKLSAAASFGFQAPQFQFTMPKLTLPKITTAVQFGKYRPLKPASKPTKRAPVRAAVRKVQAVQRKPIVLARPKPGHVATTPKQPTLASIYAMLKSQGKIIDLMVAKRQLKSSHTGMMNRDDFRARVIRILSSIDSQLGKPGYQSKYKKLTTAAGVAVGTAK